MRPRHVRFGCHEDSGAVPLFRVSHGDTLVYRVRKWTATGIGTGADLPLGTSSLAAPGGELYRVRVGTVVARGIGYRVVIAHTGLNRTRATERIRTVRFFGRSI